jgi:excisionase family DNA binding protein
MPSAPTHRPLVESDELLSPSEAARRLGIAEPTLRVWCTRGRLPFIPTPLGRVFRADEIEAIATELDAERARRAHSVGGAEQETAA